MGTGDNEESQGMCKGVLLQLPELDIVEEFLPIRLGSSDVILGVKWLDTLGDTQADWKQLTLKFEIGGRTIKLQGDPSLGRTLVSVRCMEKSIRIEEGAILVELSNVELGEAQGTVAPGFL